MWMRATSRRQAAFSLVEVTIAMGLVAFVLAALIGVFALGINSERDSIEQIGAANLASRLIGERRANPAESNVNGFALPPLDSPLVSTIYFSDQEEIVPSLTDATVTCRATNTPNASGTLAILTLDFFWPAATAAATAKPNYTVTTAIKLEP